MPQKHIPRHRRTYSKEFQTALKIQLHIRNSIAPHLPSLEVITTNQLCDFIALGMGTAKPEDIPQEPVSTVTDADIQHLITG